MVGFEIPFLNSLVASARDVVNLEPLVVCPRSDFQDGRLHCDRPTGGDILVFLVAVVYGITTRYRTGRELKRCGLTGEDPVLEHEPSSVIPSRDIGILVQVTLESGWWSC